MSKRFFKLFQTAVLILCAVIPQLSLQDKQAKKEPKPKYNKISSHVVLITINGLRADDVNKSEVLRARVPGLLSLGSKGGYAVTVESVYPSLTLPAHATMVTGSLPADHGITFDSPFNEKEGAFAETRFSNAKDIKTDTIWDAVKRANFKTASIGFPLTTGAAININIAEDQARLAEFNPSAFAVNKRLKDLELDLLMDHYKAQAAARIIEKERPNLVMVNFKSYEKAQLKYGLLSEEALLAIEGIDRSIGHISETLEKSGIAGDATLILASDCGLMRIESEFKPNVILERKKWLEADGQGRVVLWKAMARTFGGSAAIFIKNPQDEKGIQELEKLLRESHDRPDSPVWRMIARREAAQLGADHRPVFYLDAAPGYAFSSRANGSSTAKASERAARGYLPSRSEARAMLIIAGKGIKPGGKIEYARLIDIAPTIARLLGLEMKTARGRVLSEVIANEEANSQRN